MAYRFFVIIACLFYIPVHAITFNVLLEKKAHVDILITLEAPPNNLNFIDFSNIIAHYSFFISPQGQDFLSSLFHPMRILSTFMAPMIEAIFPVPMPHPFSIVLEPDRIEELAGSLNRSMQLWMFKQVA